MKLGMNIRNWGPTATVDMLTACAQAADRSGLDGLWFNDHIGFPPVLEDNPYGIPEDMGEIIDPLSFGAFLAGITSRIMFGTGVLVIPYRPQLLTNKLLSAIQVLSGNRFLLGIGPGYMPEEFRALGVDRTKRGRITDDMLQFLRDSAANPVVNANGQDIRLEPALPLPPIYIGGGAGVAIPRAVKLGDGWIPVGMPPDELAPLIVEMNDKAAAAGRGKLDTVMMKTLPLEDRQQACDLARAYQEAGVDHFVHTQGYDSPAHYQEVIDQVDGEVRAALA